MNLDNTPYLGVKKKVYSQVQAMRELGHQVDVAYCNESGLVIQVGNVKNIIELKRGITKYRYSIYKIVAPKIIRDGYQMVYIRFPGSIDIAMYLMIKALKTQGIITYLEVPTYPIVGEMTKRLKDSFLKRKFKDFVTCSVAYSIHIIARKMCAKFLDKIITFSPVESIWGAPTITIENGVNISEYEILPKKEFSAEEVVLIGVANLSIWHGYDRVIKGIAEYYKYKTINEPDVEFIIVGNGEAKEDLEKLSMQLNIKEKVKFTGNLQGNELKEVYKKSHIAMASLGMHRLGLKIASTLKTKEYCAQAFPFVYGYEEVALNKKIQFAFQIESNEAPLNIRDVNAFWARIQNIPDYQSEMYQFAKENYDWIIQMKKIFE
ncbi:glycosyltransferase [Paenibacillus sp. FSL R7-0345]|uniref:glycosyltransferase n=1 Tax=Paenibacillus sp. FSL R7-0345 TaxID=2954535 RepID=UPI00315A38D9